MRELDRIKRITDKLHDLWKEYPDMRYIQFLQFILGYLPEEWRGRDLFFLEDTEFEKMLDSIKESINNGSKS